MARMMRVIGAIGSITRLYSLAYALPAIISLTYEPWNGPLPAKSFAVFTLSGIALAGIGTAMIQLSRTESAAGLRDRDAYVTVGLGWLWLCLWSAIPFMVMGTLSNPIDAFFESMSGLTTTGSTVIVHLDELPASILIWRSELQFIGGMGIIVLSVALISRLTQGGLQMLQAETPGPSFTRIAPRLASTARILWSVYLTMAVALFLLLAGVLYWHGFDIKSTIFESLVHTMTTISTGGFSSHDASIAFFDDWIVEVLLILFMLISGTNYALHFHLLKGNPSKLWQDPEWRFFLTTYAGACLVLTGILWNANGDPIGSLRGAAFTSASLITSTGFATVDFDTWPDGAKVILMFLMVTGATSGSTGGGLKHVRVMLIFQLIRQRISQALHPRAVVPIRLGHRVLKNSTVAAIASFLMVFIGIWIGGALILLTTDAHFATVLDATSASISALSNMGPGIGAVGPTHTYAEINPSSKLLLAFEMWFGRLEIFSALILFAPETWKN